MRYGSFMRSDGGYAFGEQHSVDLAPELFAEGPLGGTLRDVEGFQERLRTLVARITTAVSRASLIVPDRWLRLVFADFDSLPRRKAERDEVLRWKLRRLVPYRLDDLRISDTDLQALNGESAGQRVLVGFGSEMALTQLETAFAAADIHIGCILNHSLGLLSAVHGALSGAGLAVVVLVGAEGYSVQVCRGGRPLLHRFKPLDIAFPPGEVANFIQRDLRLTRVFIAEQLSEESLAGALLVAPPEIADEWSLWLERGFGLAPLVLDAEHLPLVGDTPPVVWSDVAPMLGAACQEVV